MEEGAALCSAKWVVNESVGLAVVNVRVGWPCGATKQCTKYAKQVFAGVVHGYSAVPKRDKCALRNTALRGSTRVKSGTTAAALEMATQWKKSWTLTVRIIHRIFEASVNSYSLACLWLPISAAMLCLMQAIRRLSYNRSEHYLSLVHVKESGRVFTCLVS